MAKKWEQVAKNEKLDTLRADVAKIADAVGTLTRRLGDAVPQAPKKGPKKKVVVRTTRPAERIAKAAPRLPAPAKEEAKAN